MRRRTRLQWLSGGLLLALSACQGPEREEGIPLDDFLAQQREEPPAEVETPEVQTPAVEAPAVEAPTTESPAAGPLEVEGRPAAEAMPPESRPPDARPTEAPAAVPARDPAQEVQRWRELFERASFPDTFSHEILRRLEAGPLEGDPDLVLAYFELAERPDVELLRGCLGAAQPEVRRALAWGLAARGRGEPRSALERLLSDPAPAVRAAAVLALSLSSNASLVRATLPAEALSAEESELLDRPHSLGEPFWNSIAGTWAEERFAAAKRWGLIDGLPYRLVLERELMQDPDFLQAVVLDALPAEGVDWVRQHLSGAVEPTMPPELMAGILARFGPEVLLSSAGELALAWIPLLEDIALDPTSPPAAIAAVAAAAEWLSSARWSAAAQAATGSLEQAETVSRTFAELPERDALVATALLGHVAAPTKLALLNRLRHPSAAVGAALRMARVACGDAAETEGLRGELAGGSAERQVELLVQAACNGALVRGGLLAAPEPPLSEYARLVAALLLPGRAAEASLEPLNQLLAMPGARRWWCAAAQRLSVGNQLPASVLNHYPNEDLAGLNRAVNAWRVRRADTKAIELLVSAILYLESDPAVLAAVELELILGGQALQDTLFAMLGQTADPLRKARVGWILGRMVGPAILERFRNRDPGSNPAYAAALVGVAARGVGR